MFRRALNWFHDLGWPLYWGFWRGENIHARGEEGLGPPEEEDE